jgi:hypothetical protein
VNTESGELDQGGLGLNKLPFYSPANGCGYLPASPGVPALHDSGS